MLYIRVTKRPGIICLGISWPFQFVKPPDFIRAHLPKLTRRNAPTAHHHIIEIAPVYFREFFFFAGASCFPADGKHAMITACVISVI